MSLSLDSNPIASLFGLPPAHDRHAFDLDGRHFEIVPAANGRGETLMRDSGQHRTFVGLMPHPDLERDVGLFLLGSEFDDDIDLKDAADAVTRARKALVKDSDFLAPCHLTDYRDRDREDIEEFGAAAAGEVLRARGITFNAAVHAAARAAEGEGRDYCQPALAAYNEATLAAEAAMRPHTGRATGWFVTLGER